LTYEEWLEIKMAFDKEVKRLSALPPAVFWKQTNVGKCSERMRAYLEKSKELREEAQSAGWSG
jgi:uncharacterized coiled-coil protein SlyX